MSRRRGSAACWMLKAASGILLNRKSCSPVAELIVAVQQLRHEHLLFWREALVRSSCGRMFQRLFKKGDWVVYRRLKVTTSPGPRTQAVDASAHGDDYMYFVDKFWIVADVLA